MAQSDAATTAAVLTKILKRRPGNTAFLQRARLLLALFELGSITTVDATRFLDIIDPRARMFELRNLGYCIMTRPTACATESGVVHI
ncbi:helix-turn-helix domain-containing protein, partial [Burkholderia cenocepacia]|nr:helix-turn-helix domain-containing protein [Burkholderia cenocepacia]